MMVVMVPDGMWMALVVQLQAVAVCSELVWAFSALSSLLGMVAAFCV
jgi:hypothetical protein